MIIISTFYHPTFHCDLLVIVTNTLKPFSASLLCDVAYCICHFMRLYQRSSRPLIFYKIDLLLFVSIRVSSIIIFPVTKDRWKWNFGKIHPEIKRPCLNKWKLQIEEPAYETLCNRDIIVPLLGITSYRSSNSWFTMDELATNLHVLFFTSVG